MVTEKDCLDALRSAAKSLGESPTKAQYEDLGLTPASGTIQRVLGSWNDAKRAAGLETNYSRGTRVAERPANVSLPEGCSWSDLSQDQRWHYKNVEENGQRTLDRRTRHRGWVYEQKRNSGGCRRCDETDPACLDFHHRDDEEKEMTISQMITYGYSKAKISEEMAKCDILCANCHRKEHYEVPDTVGPPTVDTPDAGE
ncbi:homing endonuclease associated repeat-containing protein [Haloarcula salina]|uniref:HNH endonuclease n=1 Tax=Haloarcula salina TaxID=1429914 RepID=A0AA41G2H5_9EURY|nr:HNH endonuclease [Haloarcula salina]MBV0902281.1 HNH endonuclease [Haloarcula salina]